MSQIMNQTSNQIIILFLERLPHDFRWGLRLHPLYLFSKEYGNIFDLREKLLLVATTNFNIFIILYLLSYTPVYWEGDNSIRSFYRQQYYGYSMLLNLY